MESPAHNRRKTDHPVYDAQSARGAEIILRSRASRVIFALGLAAAGAMGAMLWFAGQG